jgi:hypothetical protein
MIFGQSGALEWRQLEDKDNCGDIEVLCYNAFDKKTYLVALSYQQKERFLEWALGDGMIQDMLPELSEGIRDVLICGGTYGV